MIKFKDNIILKNHKEIYQTVENNHYSESFGLQWKKFSKTQIDDKEHDNSKERFFNETGFGIDFFKNKTILEVGSGAGRFTNIILKYTDAIVYSVDSSSSVEVNFDNNKKYVNKRLFLFQSSLYHLPFELNQFDVVICFGVIQHTPNIRKTIKFLCENVKKNGYLIIDFYPYKGFWTKISAKYFLRPITKRLNPTLLLRIVNFYLDFFIFLSKVMIKFNLSFLNRFFPIADIKNAIPEVTNKERFREIILLDTFDMLSPKYDNPQKFDDLKKFISENQCEVVFSDYVRYQNFTSAVIRGKKN